MPCKIDQNVTCTVARLCVVPFWWRMPYPLLLDSSHRMIMSFLCVLCCVAPMWGVGRTVELRNYRGVQLSNGTCQCPHMDVR